MNNIDDILTRGVANIIPQKEALRSLLESGKKLNIYLGIDPTATKIHIGHAVPLRKLQAFAELGHHVKFLIGDFTALIGDTSDKESERPILTPEQIHANFQTYKKQAEKIIDFSKVEVVHNSEWLSKLTFAEIIQLCQHFSFGDFASRELIARRLKDKKHVGLHEALYPVMQGYDSYFMDTDIQIGGTDQTFNMQAGRVLQKDIRNKESFVLAMEFLIGSDGKKMSKTGGNAIWLDEEPSETYGKVMAINDELIPQYYLLGTNLPLEKIEQVKKRLEEGENPRDLKKELALHIVTELHGEEQAKQAQEYFEHVVQNKEMPTDIQIFDVPQTMTSGATITAFMTATGTAASNSEAKRLVEQGGVIYNNTKIDDAKEVIIPADGTVLQVGKRIFREFKIQEK